jgi:hypothetical protein
VAACRNICVVGRPFIHVLFAFFMHSHLCVVHICDHGLGRYDCVPVCGRGGRVSIIVIVSIYIGRSWCVVVVIVLMNT